MSDSPDSPRMDQVAPSAVTGQRGGAAGTARSGTQFRIKGWDIDSIVTTCTHPLTALVEKIRVFVRRGETSTKSSPIGYIDVPGVESLVANNAVEFSGWALDKASIEKVTVEREPHLGEDVGPVNERGLVFLAEAVFQNGARPDVCRAYPDYPNLHRMCWSFQLRREIISHDTSFKITLHAIAHNAFGLTTDLGRREIVFGPEGSAPPYLFCNRPFDSVYIESNGDVKPYPDCRPEKPFGSLLEPGASLESIWFGPAFTQLRQRIIDREPPPMCLSCAHFINRNVDDPAYFEQR